MKRIPTGLLGLTAIALALVACITSQVPAIRQSLIYGERFIWNVHALPGSTRDVVVGNVALSGSEDTRLNFVTRLSSNGQLLWETPSMIAPENKPVIALSADVVIVAFNTQLTALAAHDGAAQWSVKLSGRMGFCDTCLLIVGDRVVAYSDKALEGFDLATGKRIWSQRIPRNVPILQPAGAWLAVALPQTINLYQPADGKVALQIPAQCEGSPRAGLPRDISPILLGNAGNNDLFVRLDTCVQRWDLQAGKRAWDVAFSKDKLGQLGNFKGFLRRKQSEMAQAGAHVFVSTGESLQQKAPRGLMVIDTASGEARSLVTSDEHYLIPIATVGQDVLVRVKQFRGATFDELWSINIATGKRNWLFKPDKLSDWDVLVTPSAQGLSLALIQFGSRDTTEQVRPFLTRAIRSDVVVQVLNPQTGTPTELAPVRMQLADANWIEATQDASVSTLFLNFGTLYAIDLKTLERAYQWP